MRPAFDPTYPRYIGVALISALLNNVILILGDRLGYGYAELVGLTFLITGSIAYLMHSRLTFRQRTGWRRYARFMAGIALGIPVALAVIVVLREGLGLKMQLAAPIATVLMIVYNYISARMAILLTPFSKRAARSSIVSPAGIDR